VPGADSASHQQRTPVHPKESFMKTSLSVRLASFAASVVVTLGIVWMVADYAYPPAPAMQLAASVR
jgi:hypothetical protein